MSRVWLRARLRLASLIRERAAESGYAAIVMAMITAGVLFPISALAVDVSRWYVEGERVQAAADAAAMAGVTYLPQDLTNARATAIVVADKNGYPNSGTSTVTATFGDKPTQLKVTVTSRIHNTIADSFGKAFTTISRTAVADYNSPAPMGSPCNTLGNEPDGVGVDAGSKLTVPSGATCSRTTGFWTSVYGPDIYKVDGDQVMVRNCAGGDTGCTGTANAEFKPQGYFYAIHVSPGSVGLPVTVQIYDPAYVVTGQQCQSGPSSSGSVGAPRNGMNPYAPDGLTRYALALNQFCNGDNRLNSVSGGDVPTVTSFGMRSPIDTFVATDAPPMSGCVKQYPGYDANAVRYENLDSTKAATYNQRLAAVFHQWRSLCTFTPTQQGDYYLQIRTNVALSTANYDGLGGYNGNMAVFNQKTDNLAVHGSGGNTFAIRAFSSASGSLSVAGYERMSIWQNLTGSTATFNLVRVVPAAASKTLDFEFFDAGDAAAGGSITLLPPTETAMTLSNCVGSGVVVGALAGCRVNVSSSFNGKSQHIRVPILSTYTCNWAATGGCWWRVTVNFGSAAVHDTTTWTAKIDGDPVRLIK